MNLAVLGCGYVGLVSGACLAEAGHDVICTDVDAGRIAQLQSGNVPIRRRCYSEPSVTRSQQAQGAYRDAPFE